MTLDLYTELGFLHDAMLKVSSEISKSNNISELLGLANAQLELVTTSCELKSPIARHCIYFDRNRRIIR